MTYEVGPVSPTARRPFRGRVKRGGGIGAAALVIVVGAAVAVGAGLSPRSAAGADPAAGTASSASPSGHAAERFGLLGNGKNLPGDLRGGRGFGGGFRLRGITITSINGTKIGLKTVDGWTRTIDIGADTKIYLGSEVATLTDLKVGYTVVMRQKRNTDGTFSVVALRVPAAHASGEVTAVTATSITIKHGDGSTTTLTVDGSTVYHQGAATGTKADVKVGSRIDAEGKPGSTESFTATAVRIELARVAGQVTAKTASTITVKLRDNSSVVLHVDATTRFFTRAKGATTTTLADVAVGDGIVANGVKRADGSLDARAVGAGKLRMDRANSSKSPAPATP